MKTSSASPSPLASTDDGGLVWPFGTKISGASNGAGRYSTRGFGITAEPLSMEGEQMEASEGTPDWAATAKSDPAVESSLPMFLTPAEAATLLRTSRKAVYQMVERRQLPGVTRVGRRILLRSRGLLDWLDQKRAPSLEE